MDNMTKDPRITLLPYESPCQEIIVIVPCERILNDSPQPALEPITPGQGYDW
jgi:hypothetical protein